MTKINYKKYLDPKFITKLKSIDLRAKLVVEGFLEGLHRSPYKGSSIEFSEYRPYIPGDDPRRIDWKVYARRDRFYVKEYQEETNLKAYILLDCSGSMNYGTPITKFEYASILAASLCFILIKQKDSVGLACFDTDIKEYIPPKSSTSHLKLLLTTLETTSPSGKTEISKALHKLAETIKKRGLVIVISDLLDSPEKILKSLKHIRHRKHEVIVFQILNPDELNFPFHGSIEVKDIETGKKLFVEAEIIKKDYIKGIKEFTEFIHSGCAEHNIDHNLLVTDTSLERALMKYLEKRRRMR